MNSPSSRPDLLDDSRGGPREGRKLTRQWVEAGAVALVAGAMLVGGLAGAADSGEGLLEGELAVTMRGPGAAPFGIAAALFGGMSTAYNLGQLGQVVSGGGGAGWQPRSLFDADETYQGTLSFALRAETSDRWVLDRLQLDYFFVDRTGFAEDEVEIRDQMHDSGRVSWASGVWSGPSGWDPQVQPEIELRLFEAATAAACEDGVPLPGLGWVERLLSRAGDGVRCYEVRFLVPHPMRPSGRSVWSSPMGEVSVDAKDGRLVFKGRSAIDLDQLPIPAQLPPEARKFFLQSRELERMLADGIAELEPDADMTWERTFRGPVEGWIHEGSTYAILTGAQVRESLELPIVDLVLERVDEGWEPRGDDRGRPAEIRVRPRSDDSEPVPVRITLSEVTREKGTSLNSQDESKELDLVVDGAENAALFESPRQTSDGWIIETREPVREATLVVRARDFGAWGRVKAEGRYGESWFTLAVDDSEKPHITLPRDERGGVENRVWDRFEERMNVDAGVGGEIDDDWEPVSEHDGDGLSLYEEYRGFEVFGEHVRTDPMRKTLFVHVQPGSGLYDYAKGVGGLTELEVHVIRAAEFRGTKRRVVNPNRGLFSRTEQHGLYLVNRKLEAGVLGEAAPAECIGSSPGCFDEIRVDRSKFKECVQLDCADDCCDEATCAEEHFDQRKLRRTVTHELLHGLGVQHHGDEDWREAELCYHTEEDARGCWVGQHYPTPCDPGDGQPLEAYVARPEGEHAGDQRCVMSYRSADFYRRPSAGWARKPGGKFLLPFEIPPVYLDLCTSGAGTLFNAGDGVGPAARGACGMQIHVSDAGSP